MSARARARVRVVGRFDGAHTATVTIEIAGGGEWLFSVRPYRRRRAYTLPLEAVARGVIFDVTRAEIAARAREKAKRRSLNKRSR